MTKDINGIRLITMKSSDLNRTARFYRGLFGWDCQTLSDTFLGFDPDFGPSGGFILSQNPISDNSMTLYVEVTEIAQSRRQAVELGGVTLGDLVAVPDFGSYALIRDPDGNRIGLWKSDQAAEAAAAPAPEKDVEKSEAADPDTSAPTKPASPPAPADSTADFEAALADETGEVFADLPRTVPSDMERPATPSAKPPPPTGQAKPTHDGGPADSESSDPPPTRSSDRTA